MTKTFSALAVVPALAATLVVAACASTGAGEPDGDRRFYEARCGVCHVPYPRDAYPAAEWPKILDAMAPRAGLTTRQRERVMGYVLSR